MNFLSFPTLTVAVSPPFTTFPGPLFFVSAPSSTLTLSVTFPDSPAGTLASVHVTFPPFSEPAGSRTPSFEASTNCTFASSSSSIVTFVASDL